MNTQTVPGDSGNPPREPNVGSDIIDQMVAMPTLDRFFDVNPNKLSDDDLLEFIGIQRRARAMFIEKG